MGSIGMREAGKRLNMAPNSARRALQNAGVELAEISPRAYAVDEQDLQAFIDSRAEYGGRGRPPGAKSRKKKE